jgi:lipoate-protein ligase A
MRSAPAPGGWNMALDQALLAHARHTGTGVWRCYAWSSQTVSFGRNETVLGRFDAGSLSRAGLAAVRRPTGGRALLHGREVTYSAVFPLDASIAWREAYAAVNAILLAALHSLGVHATLVAAERGVAHRPDGPLCFEAPAVGEIEVRGAKLVGSAVWRERGAYLQHGSILLHDDQRQLVDAALPIADTHRPLPAASLSALCTAAGRPVPEWSDVADALEMALCEQVSARPMSLDATLIEATKQLVPQFTSDAWLWRR